MNAPGIQQTPRIDVSLTIVGAIISCFSMADVLHVRSEKNMTLRKIWDREDCAKQQLFSIVKEQFLGAPLCRTELSFLSPSADHCSCIPGSGQVRVGGQYAELSASLQIIFRLQVKCRSESITEQKLFFVFG